MNVEKMIKSYEDEDIMGAAIVQESLQVKNTVPNYGNQKIDHVLS